MYQTPLATVIVCMSPAFVDTPEKIALIPRHIEVIRWSFANAVPIIVFNFDPVEACGRDDLFDTHPQLACVLDEIPHMNITKRSDRDFNGTNLASVLRKAQKDQVLLIGVNACCMVYHTARYLRMRGVHVITGESVIGGYCSSCTRESRIHWYSANGVYVPGIKTQNVLAECHSFVG